MSFDGTARKRLEDLYDNVLDLRGVSKVGTCDTGMSGSTTAIVCAELGGEGDDYYNSGWVMVIIKNANSVGNAPEGEFRDITDYVSSSGTFTVAAFSANAEASDEILVFRRLDRQVGQTQIIEVSITAAANASVTTVATITDQPCLLKSAVIHADAAQTGDMTTAALEGGTGQVVEFIGVGTATQANLDAADKQVSWTGAVRFAAAEVISIDLQGTGATAVDLTITIEYEACVDGGYLA